MFLVSKALSAVSRPVLCTAEYGSAASNLNTGSTVCKVFGFVGAQGNQSVKRRANVNAPAVLLVE